MEYDTDRGKGEDLLPSGSNGLILGLILGLKAGDTIVEPLALMLPRFLLDLPPLPSFLLSLRSAAGVLATMGEATTEGLAKAESGLAVCGVSNGPSFGVLRAADIRGVVSVDDAGSIEVVI